MDKTPTKTRTVTELSESEMLEFKRMYMEYVPVTEISRHFNINRSTVSWYVNKHYVAEREMMRAELFRKFTDTKRTNFIKMSQSSIEIITRALQELAQRNVPPTVVEAQRATQILEALDKITRLDEGNPTEIVAEKPLSAREIKEKLLLDPFNDDVGEEDVVNFRELEQSDS